MPEDKIKRLHELLIEASEICYGEDSGISIGAIDDVDILSDAVIDALNGKWEPLEKLASVSHCTPATSDIPEIGTIVRLKSGGPRMTVYAHGTGATCNVDHDLIHCRWFDLNQRLDHSGFKPEELTKLPD